ncbi:hypothetical protein [Actinomadura formosensis]|uniref:hypothetical protein n=1 Tax=Actinomadura formosensis TaxID=60706 RepID=UPI003D9109F3
MTINVDQDIVYGDDPLAVMGMRRTMASACAATLTVLGIGSLLSSLAVGVIHLWTLGLAGLIAAGLAGCYAGYLGAARMALRELAHTAHADETRAEITTAMEREILARLDSIDACLERHVRRAGDLAADVENLRRRQEQIGHRQQRIAHTVADILDDELRTRRRSG